MGKLAATTCETAKPDKSGRDRLPGATVYRERYPV